MSSPGPVAASGGPAPPAASTVTVRPVTDLRREDFTEVKTIRALLVPAKEVSAFVHALRPYNAIFHQKNLKGIVSHTDGRKLVLLDPSVSDCDLSGLCEPARSSVLSSLSACGGLVVEHSVTVGYDMLPPDVILRRLLPAGMDIPAGFEPVGHIAHVNLRDEALPYKYIIGAVLLDKNPCIRTVVNKVGVIENEFRTLPMEIIAGEDNLDVEVTQDGCTFLFNFRDVYWNSKLQTEHSRIAKLFRTDEVICDMFCGIGPFAVPLAVRGCTVHANDLNTASVKYLRENAVINKVAKHLHCYNLDGRDFMRQCVSSGIVFHHVLMNLPAIALEFLDVFVGLFPPSFPSPLPTVHCYCFSSKGPEESVQEITDRVCAALSRPSPPPGLAIRSVRDISPKKLMFCVTFQIPEDTGRAVAAVDAVPAEAAAPASPSDDTRPEKRARVVAEGKEQSDACSK